VRRLLVQRATGVHTTAAGALLRLCGRCVGLRRPSRALRARRAAVPRARGGR